MGRRKKSEIEAENTSRSNLLVCPICGKEFKPTEETYCWVREDFTNIDKCVRGLVSKSELMKFQPTIIQLEKQRQQRKIL